MIKKPLVNPELAKPVKTVRKKRKSKPIEVPESYLEIIVNQYKNSNPTREARLLDLMNNLDYLARKKRSMYESIAELNAEMLDYSKRIEKVKREPEDNYDKVKEEAAWQFKKIQEHPLVSKIDWYGMDSEHPGYLLIHTEMLTYRNGSFVMPVGEFLIFIKGGNIKVLNKTFTFKGYHHPCIGTGGDVCYGDETKREVFSLLSKANIAGAVFLTINFLQEPNYGRPYINEKEFRFAQKIRKRFTDDWERYNYDYSKQFKRTLYMNDQSNFTTEMERMGLPVHFPDRQQNQTNNEIDDSFEDSSDEDDYDDEDYNEDDQF